jgi:NTE family protein
MSSRSTRVAFVLSGGASLGAVQIGMLRALYEREIVPELIVGTSVGAINGAYIASRPPTVETLIELESIWRKLRRTQIFPLNPLSGLLGCIGSRDHLVPGSGLRSLLREHVVQESLQETPIEFHVVAVDVLTGEELLLSRGSVLEAMLASAAIPAVLPPVAWDGRMLMDGGVANNTPISHAVALGARTIYVLPTGHACALDQPPASALGMALHALSLLSHSRLIADIELHRDNAKLVVLPPPCPLDIQPIDFTHASELIACALTDARALLDSGGRERPPIRMRMHRHARPGKNHPAGVTKDACESSSAISSH